MLLKYSCCQQQLYYKVSIQLYTVTDTVRLTKSMHGVYKYYNGVHVEGIVITQNYKICTMLWESTEFRLYTFT